MIRLAATDVENSDAVRALLSDALTVPKPRVLADLSGLQEVGGPLIAAMIIASAEMVQGGRFALYAPEHLFEQISDWCIEGSWACFGDWDLATDYLCADAH